MATSIVERSDARSDIGLRELVAKLWRQRVLLGVVTAVCVIAAGIGGIVTPKKYQSSVIFAIATNDINGMDGVRGMISQLGPLASLAAGAFGRDANQGAEAVAVLQSRALTEMFVKEAGLLPILFADSWDEGARQWRVERPEQAPTLWDANESFEEIRTVVQDSKTRLFTLTITWTDPAIASRWANELISRTNRALQQRAISDSKRNIDYLNQQVGKTDVIELRAAIFKLLEREIQKVMLAQGNDEYALRVIDPAVPAERPSSPGLIVWLLAGFIGGLFVSILFILLRDAWLGEPRA